MSFCRASLGNSRGWCRTFWRSLRNASLGKPRVHAKKVVQKMRDRLQHNKNVSDVSMNSEKMHISIWTLFMASSMQAALHMDLSYAKNLEIFKNYEFENVESLFSITRMMIGGNSEIKNVFFADAASLLWEKFTLLNDLYVYSDYVLCLGKTHGPEDAIREWDHQVSTFKMYHTFRELQGLDGAPINFEWKVFPGATALDLLHKIQADVEGKHIVSDRIIFMSMFNDIDLDKNRNEDSCTTTSREIKEYASNFNDGHWAFQGLGEENKWYQRYAINCCGNWDLRASQMVEDFENSGHPVFQGVNPLGRGILKKKKIETPSISGEYCNRDLLYRTIRSANQL